MWNPFRPKQADAVISHRYAFVPNFNTSTKEFYADVEKELEARQVPGLEIRQVDFAEGGLLSAQRKYLRLTRERLVVDICAAPFGTAYFFSLRFADLPAAIKFWQLLLAMLLLFAYVAMMLWIFKIIYGTAILTGLLVISIVMARNAVAMGLHDLDALLMRMPLIGALYERFIRKETYYRIDTRIMFQEAINAIVMEKMEQVTLAKGVTLNSVKQRHPSLDDLYRATLIHPDPPKTLPHGPSR
jgi:hypothetical protein